MLRLNCSMFMGLLVAGALIVGLVISFIQALTQIQEMTLSFVPKMAAIFVTFALFGHIVLTRRLLADAASA